MDKFDLEILEILQNNNQTPQRDIGEHIGLSAAAVQRRIKKLRQDGIIIGDIAVLDRERLGNPVTVVTEVFLESEKIELIDEARTLFLETPEVQQCYYVTGEADFVLIITVASMAEYEKLTRRIFFGVENVKRFKTTVVMSVDKVGLNLPIHPALD